MYVRPAIYIVAQARVSRAQFCDRSLELTLLQKDEIQEKATAESLKSHSALVATCPGPLLFPWW